MLKHISLLLGLIFSLEAGAAISVPDQVSLGIPKNYVLNGGAERSTAGWITYSDAAGTSPVDCTGGSPNVTWTSSTSSPLDDSASFVLTKDAANRQGQGASYAFSIDPAAQGKVIAIQGDYQIASGTYADGDARIYIYDVTNGVVIEPAPTQVLNSTIRSKLPQISFQSAINSTSYRMCVHVASTSSSAYTVKFDNLVAAPQNYTYGATVTDWISFTPTTSTANATVTGRYRRIGDSVEIYALVKMTGAATSAVNVSLPTGLSVDTSKLPNTAESQSIGSVYMLDSGTAHYVGSAVWESAATAITLFGNNVANRVNNGPNPFTIANGDVFSLVAALPISGWSSNVVVSDQTDTRVVAGRFYLSSGKSVTTANNSTIAYQATSYDTHGGYNSSTGEYTIQVTGKYRMKAQSLSDASTAVRTATLRIHKNTTVGTPPSGGTTLCDGRSYKATTSSADRLTGLCSTEADLVAGDKISVSIQSTDTGYTTAAGENADFFEISRISGPAQIAASESVNARYYGVSATQSVSSAAAITTFDTKSYDSHNAFNNSTGIYTCPTSGKYLVSFQVSTNGTVTATSINGRLEVRLYYNGNLYSQNATMAAQTSTGQFYAVPLTDTVFCTAGSTITPEVLSSLTGGSVTVGSGAFQNTFTIQRIGN